MDLRGVLALSAALAFAQPALAQQRAAADQPAAGASTVGSPSPTGAKPSQPKTAPKLGPALRLDPVHTGKALRSEPRQVPTTAGLGDLGRIQLDTGTFGFSTDTKMKANEFPDGLPLPGPNGSLVKTQSRSYFGLSLSMPTEEPPPAFRRDDR